MKSISLHIPGDFEEGVLYQGRLILLTPDKKYKIFYFDRMVHSLRHQNQGLQTLLEFMFLRNDWLASEQFSSLMRSSEIANAFFRLFADRNNQVFTIDNASDFSVVLDTEIDADIILDMSVYFNRLYIGTENGLFDAQLNLKKQDSIVSKPRRRHDAPCLHTVPRYGVINASCGSDGLFCAYEDDFSGDLFNRNQPRGAELQQKVQRSLRTSWIDYNIVNYPTNGEPRIIQTKHEHVGDDDERSYTKVTGIEREEKNIEYIFEALHDKYQVAEADIQYTFNVVNTYFMRAYSGSFYGVGLKKDAVLPKTASFVKQYHEVKANLLGAESLGANGQVIETDNAVLLFSDNHFYSLLDEPAYVVKTIGSSKRYKNLVLIITTEGVTIVSSIDDNKFIRLSKPMNTPGAVDDDLKYSLNDI